VNQNTRSQDAKKEPGNKVPNKDQENKIQKRKKAHHKMGLCDPDWIQTNDLLLSLPLRFSPLRFLRICGLDYNFTIAGVPRLVSTEPF